MGEIQGHCDERFGAVRETLEASFASGEVGAAVAVHHEGEFVVDLWGGTKDAAGTLPWERDTVVNVYSTTKGLTALRHRLVEEGRLDRDAPVATCWPEFAQAGQEALPVRYLLSHQARLPAVQAPLPRDALYDWNATCAALAAQAPCRVQQPERRQGHDEHEGVADGRGPRGRRPRGRPLPGAGLRGPGAGRPARRRPARARVDRPRAQRAGERTRRGADGMPMRLASASCCARTSCRSAPTKRPSATRAPEAPSATPTRNSASATG